MKVYPKMQRRHFQLIARVIAETPLKQEDKRNVAINFAHALARTNPSFKPNRFLKACEVYQ